METRIKTRTSRLWFLWSYWFPGSDYRKVYIPFGTFVSTPDGRISADLWVHESTHIKQQKHSFLYSLWWHLKYRISSTFRMEQEIEAYRAQIGWFRQNGSINRAYEAKLGMAKLLASPMYGFNITTNEAFERLGEA